LLKKKITSFQISHFGAKYTYLDKDSTKKSKKIEEPFSDLYAYIIKHDKTVIDNDNNWNNLKDRMAEKNWKKGKVLCYNYVEKKWFHVDRKVKNKRKTAGNDGDNKKGDGKGVGKGMKV